MNYYDIYNKRLNRYGNDYQSRLQGKREHQFELYLSRSVYYTVTPMLKVVLNAINKMRQKLFIIF